MKVSKGQSQPEIVAAAFLILYMVLGIDHFNAGFHCDSGAGTSLVGTIPSAPAPSPAVRPTLAPGLRIFHASSGNLWVVSTRGKRHVGASLFKVGPNMWGVPLTPPKTKYTQKKTHPSGKVQAIWQGLVAAIRPSVAETVDCVSLARFQDGKRRPRSKIGTTPGSIRASLFFTFWLLLLSKASEQSCFFLCKSQVPQSKFENPSESRSATTAMGAVRLRRSVFCIPIKRICYWQAGFCGASGWFP